MGCHTWIYKKIKDLTPEEYIYVRKNCDDEINDVLNDNTSAEELYKLYKKFYTIAPSISDIKESIKKRKEKAQYFKDNIDKYPDLLIYYNLSIDINGEVYINVGTYDELRIYNYPDGNFDNPQQLIDFCKNTDWEDVYFYDENENRIEAKTNIEGAINIINKMFMNKNIVVNFG